MPHAPKVLRNVALLAGLIVVVASCNCGGPVVVNPDLPDAGPGLACGVCTSDSDCDPQGKCITATTGEKACVPRCDPAKPSCPVGFTCKASGNASACIPDNGACCIDSDQDEHGRGVACRNTDCDDTKATVNPAAAETCNGVDDNCNGMVDEGLVQTTCGVGACSRTVDACTAGTPQTCTPGAPTAETCNGLDDDCNGMVDDALANLTCGVGVCQRVVPACIMGAAQLCAPGDAGVEACNGLDDDCDGLLDDGLGQTTCGVGACARSVENCVDAGTITCVPGTPGAETCNSIDDDCNGQLDDGLGQTMCGVGACARIVDNCVDGGATTCTPGMPSTEICNGLDDDCNGQLDEGFGVVSCGVGACARTISTCADGGTATCTPGTPGPESCNGIDDDCNGQLDDGLAPTTCGVGACARTVVSCADGGATTCTPGMPGVETCNGVDDNCDGQLDEGLGQSSCGVGACARTTDSCVDGGVATCVPGMPAMETCNGLDDNCNGMPDDGLGSTTCGVGACRRTVQNCSGGMPQMCVPGMGGPEVCDGIDNNCDGNIDEGNPGGGSSCNTGQQGVCAAGMTVCSMGTVSCQPQTMASPEICDGQDNDCNGATDEGNPGGGAACMSNLPGVCTPGTTTCQMGSLRCISNIMPATEICNGLDDSCDGMVDNAPITTLCPPPAGVATTSCGGMTGCEIATCGAQNYNLDGMYANGCECNDPLQTTCSMPHDLGSVGVAGITTGPTNRAPASSGAGSEDWYRVSFPATGASGSGRGGGRPTIEFAAGSDSSFRFDVYSDGCGMTARNCGRNNMLPPSIGLTSWDFYDQNTDTSGTSQWTSPRNAWPTTVHVRVYRASPGQSCVSYQLRARRP